MTQTPQDALRSALQDRDGRLLCALLERHPDLRAKLNEPVFPFNTPAIVHFARDEDPTIVEVLLEFGADPNRRSSWWAGPFHALHGASQAAADRLMAAGAIPDACAAAHLDRPDLLARLLEEDPARVHERGGDGQTPLHFARSREVIDLLLDAGADIDARDVDHRSTPAQWMLDQRRGEGRYDLAAYLVERGATTDIFLAAALGLSDRVRDLLREDPSRLELRTTQGPYSEQPPSSYHIYMWTIGAELSPMQVAAQFGHPETLDVMRGVATLRQRFLEALVEGDGVEVQTLLGADANLLTALTPADRRLLPQAAWNCCAPAVKLMLELGFNPGTPDQNGATALHCAAWQGSAECVKLILDHPAAPELVDRREPTHGATPFGWCCHGSDCGPKNRQHLLVARLLLEAGAQPDPDLGRVSDEVRALVDGWRK